MSRQGKSEAPSCDPAFASGAALVAGGSGGIGSEVAMALARSGSNVVVTYRSNRAAAEDVVARVRAEGVAGSAVALDLVDAAKVQAAVDDLVAEFGRLHSVVYAAGPALHMEFIHDLSVQEWSRIVQTDVCGAFHLVKAALPHLRHAGGGAMVGVITSAVERVPARDICSAAPKAAIEMLFRGVAKEEGRYGVRANCVGPGWVDAGLGRAVMGEELSAEQIEQIRRAIPLKRIGQAHEIAEAVAFLLSSKASYITGQSLAVDGGLQL